MHSGNTEVQALDARYRLLIEEIKTHYQQKDLREKKTRPIDFNPMLPSDDNSYKRYVRNMVRFLSKNRLLVEFLFDKGYYQTLRQLDPETPTVANFFEKPYSVDPKELLCSTRAIKAMCEQEDSYLMGINLKTLKPEQLGEVLSDNMRADLLRNHVGDNYLGDLSRDALKKIDPLAHTDSYIALADEVTYQSLKAGMEKDCLLDIVEDPVKVADTLGYLKDAEALDVRLTSEILSAAVTAQFKGASSPEVFREAMREWWEGDLTAKEQAATLERLEKVSTPKEPNIIRFQRLMRAPA